jgi:thioesterase domain-containing protein
VNAQAKTLEATIRGHIPLSEAMGFAIDSLTSNEITVKAPLAPNVNIHGTGFAGSIYSLAVLTGWGLTTHLISESGIAAELVVGKADILYLSPVSGDLCCYCQVGNAEREQFLQTLQDKGKARLRLQVTVGEPAAATLNGVYFAIKS